MLSARRRCLSCACGRCGAISSRESLLSEGSGYLKGFVRCIGLCVGRHCLLSRGSASPPCAAWCILSAHVRVLRCHWEVNWFSGVASFTREPRFYVTGLFDASGRVSPNLQRRSPLRRCSVASRPSELGRELCTAGARFVLRQ